MSIAGKPTCPVTAAQAMRGALAPAPPPITMFCGVRRLSQTVYTIA